MPFFHVYVLQSEKDKQFYTGITNNIERRPKQHNRGHTRSTSYRLPIKLIFYESFLSKHDALRRERYFKTTKGKTTLKQNVAQLPKS
ncbi:MAG: GIY-YIG nuclease family protein [Candidatus Kerfeldbacteria bacterium]|nr:GIY-YIG nuclease family protein [Candidatus Kerfeldbacteria bacterium]